MHERSKAVLPGYANLGSILQKNVSEHDLYLFNRVP